MRQCLVRGAGRGWRYRLLTSPQSSFTLLIASGAAAQMRLSAPAFNSPGFATMDQTLCVREETKISERQLGRKIGKHAADFGLDPANAVHRAQLCRLITEIIIAPDRVVAGTFRGQGAVKFFIKGEDIVVTT